MTDKTDGPGLRGTLQGLISYLGLSQLEAAQIIGIGHEALSRKLEGKERYDTRAQDVAPLQALADKVDGYVERTVAFAREALAAPREPIPDSHFNAEFKGEKDRVALVVYRKDADLPPWTDLPYASVARLAAARIARGIGGGRAHLVAFDRKHYNSWLGDRPDSQANRGWWARQQVQPKSLGLKVNKESVGWAVIRASMPGGVGIQEAPRPPAAAKKRPGA